MKIKAIYFLGKLYFAKQQNPFKRNVFPSERVKKALSVIEKALKNQNYIDDRNILINKGVLFSGYEDITSHPDFKLFYYFLFLMLYYL